MGSTDRRWLSVRSRCAWSARTSGGAGTRSWTAPLPGVSPVCCAMSRCGAGGGSRCWAGKVRPARPVAGLAPLGAVSPIASDREQHAVSDSARGVGDCELGVAGAGAKPSAAECGLGGGVRALELETFVDPSRFHGGAYDASNWVRVGRTRGFARHNGAYTDPHRPRRCSCAPCAPMRAYAWPTRP